MSRVLITTGSLRRRLTDWLTAALLFSIVNLPAFAETDSRLPDAAKSQDWAEVTSLLNEKGIDVNATHADGASALAYATYWDDINTVQRLLHAGADPNIANDYGVSPLMLAIENLSADIVKSLLDGKADPNHVMWSGESALMAAARRGFMEAVQMLLDQGVDINYRDPRRGQSALMWAISFRSPDVARTLIERGADINTATIRLNEDFTSMKLEGYMGSYVETVPMGGYTPLIFAASVDDMLTAKLLVERGANVNHLSEQDGSALTIAAVRGNEELALYLLDAGSDPNVVDHNGMAPLHYALRDGIKVLHGRIVSDKPMVCNFGGESYLCRPYETLNKTDLARLDDPETELYIVKGDDVQGYGEYSGGKPLPGPNMDRLVVALLANGADPNAKMELPPASLRLDRNPWFTMEGSTPFFLAAASQNLDAVSILLEEGAKPLIKTELNDVIYNTQLTTAYEDNMIVGNASTLLATVGLGRRTDLTLEEEENAIEIAKILISLGADVNEASVTGWTSLHAAAFLGSDKLVSFLVEQGAEIDAMTGCGRTPISLALADSNVGMVDRTLPRIETAELLLELGAGKKPPVGPIGDCVGGRGGLDADTRLIGQADLALRDAVQAVKQELEAREAIWREKKASL